MFLLAEVQCSHQEQRDLFESLKSAKEAQEKEFEAVKEVMEEVTDQEIEELRARYGSMVQKARLLIPMLPP